MAADAGHPNKQSRLSLCPGLILKPVCHVCPPPPCVVLHPLPYCSQTQYLFVLERHPSSSCCVASPLEPRVGVSQRQHPTVSLSFVMVGSRLTPRHSPHPCCPAGAACGADAAHHRHPAEDHREELPRGVRTTQGRCTSAGSTQ